jgi:aryl-alcohol dehydrogenase-like predicted oxidoreductase
LASGFLTGKYRSEADLSKSARGSGIGKKYLNERGFRILAALDEIAAAHKVTPAAIALAWLMHRNSVTAPIASATSVEQLKQLAASAQINLSDEQVAALDVASAY